MMRALLVIALIASCDQASSVGGFLKSRAEEVGAAHVEILCLAHPAACGDVYMCEAEAENDLGHVEICIQRDQGIDKAEDAFGECKPTPRHAGLCYWHCDAGAGCNAFSGCWGCP